MCFEKIFGRDVDDVFAYQTPKVVRIRDRRLGLLHFLLMFLIGTYVIGFQILRNNEHFKKKDVFGTGRITLQQPTRACNPKDKGCLSNFHSLRDLPYCDAYDGNSSGIPAAHRHPCIFADQHTLAPAGMVAGTIFIPTRIDRLVQRRACLPSEANDYTCDNEYVVEQPGEVTYVADIERYTIMISHSFQRQHLKGSSVDQEGFVQECIPDEEVSWRHSQTGDYVMGMEACHGTVVQKPIPCLNDKCTFISERPTQVADTKNISEARVGKASFLSPRRNMLKQPIHRTGVQLVSTKNDEAASMRHTSSMRPQVDKWAVPGFFAIPQGDVFTVEKLLQLCDLSLDGTINRDGEPLRESGTAIEIYVRYTNLIPFASSFGHSKVSYTYQVSERSMLEMKSEQLGPSQPDFPEKRLVEDRHGLYITVKIGGSFGFFSMVYTLIMLTTALGLLGAAVVITDMLALYLMNESEIYRKHKFEETDDFSERKGFSMFGYTESAPGSQAAGGAGLDVSTK